MSDAEETPLDRLFAGDPDEVPEEIAVDALTTIDADEFVDRLESVAAAADAVETIAADLATLRETGLTDDDARDLIYGRNSGVTKSEIESLFDAVDDLESGRASRPDVRLIANLSDLTLSEAEELFEELERLHGRYGGYGDR